MELESVDFEIAADFPRRALSLLFVAMILSKFIASENSIQNRAYESTLEIVKVALSLTTGVLVFYGLGFSAPQVILFVALSKEQYSPAGFKQRERPRSSVEQLMVAIRAA